MAVTTDLIAKYMNEGLNILILGEAGTGKTTMIQEAAKQLKWRMKYFSTPTLDPFSDLIGLPVPDHGRKTVNYYRPRDIDGADVVFFDELNRGDIMVLNTVLEIVQFRSINGEELRNLKCCVAAINPATDGYATRELDIALHDRFQVRLESDPNPSKEYFHRRFGEYYANAGLDLWNEYQDRRLKGENLPHFSPRRLDTLLSVYQKFPVVETVRAIVPGQGTINFNEWAKHLADSIGIISTPVADDLEDQIPRAFEALRGNFSKNNYAKKEILRVYLMAYTARHPRLKLLKREMIVGLNQYLSTPEDLLFFKDFLMTLSKNELTALTHNWPDAKANQAFALAQN